MLHIVKHVKDRLLGSGLDKIYTTEVRDRVYPYITMKLNTTRSVSYQEDFTLDVDVWNEDTDIVEIETLASQVKEYLNGFVVLNKEQGYSLHIVYTGTLNLDEVQNKLQRRRVRFKIYESNERGLVYYGNRLR